MRQLLFDAAVEASAILMAAAGSEDDDLRESLQESADGGGAFDRLIEKIEPELEKSFASLGFAPRVFQQRGTSGRPRAIQMRGRDLFCAMIAEESRIPRSGESS